MDWRMVIAVLMVLSTVVLVSGCTGGSKEYSGSYMSFSYPENWQIDDTEPTLISFTYQNKEDKKLNSATVTVGQLVPGKEESLVADGYAKKTVNGYTFYERSSTGSPSTTILRSGVFVTSNMTYTIGINGEKSEVNKGFDMIVNSFKIK